MSCVGAASAICIEVGLEVGGWQRRDDETMVNRPSKVLEYPLDEVPVRCPWRVACTNMPDSQHMRCLLIPRGY